jgi:hypothetical protein
MSSTPRVGRIETNQTFMKFGTKRRILRPAVPFHPWVGLWSE